MKKNLCVYFGESRTYFCVTERTSRGIELKYIKSLKLIPDFDEKEFYDGSFQYDLGEVTNEAVREIEKIIPVMPYSKVFSCLMPAPKNMTVEELKKLFKFELRQNFSDTVYEDFSAYCLPFSMSMGDENYILGLFVRNKVAEICKSFLSAFNLPIDDMVLPQKAIVHAYDLNYPENSSKLSVLLFFGFKFSSVTVCKGKEMLYYSGMNYDNHLLEIENFQREIEKAKELINEDFDNLFLYGEALTPMILEEYKKAFRNKFSFISRLNAFRMLTTKLGGEYREYCNRMAHVYPACVGAGINENLDVIKII